MRAKNFAAAIAFAIGAFAVAAGFGGCGGQPVCSTNLGTPHTSCVCPPVDLAGPPSKVCGMPDASYSEAYCACIGDP